MSGKLPTQGPEFLDELIARVQRIEAAWLRLYEMIRAYPQPGAPQGNLEIEFLDTKSAVARELPAVLAKIREQASFGNELVNFLAGAMSLHALYGQSEVAVNKTVSEWNRCYMAVHETLGVLQDQRRRVEAGERVVVGGVLVHTPRPFPWRPVMAGAALVLLAAAGYGVLYVRREFLGIGAPEAGEGLATDDTLSDAGKISLLQGQMQDAFKAGDLDTMMAFFTDDFVGPEGYSKTTLRVFIAGFIKSYGIEAIELDMSGATALIEGDIVIFEPVQVKNPVDTLALRIVGRKRDGRWLITKIEAR